jgi:glycosyltransferase involved in cell wall biosynthesis
MASMRGERDRPGTERPRIAAIVLNSVNHDARVLKEADALAAAGCDVLILGLADDRCSEPESVRASGVVIRRIDHGRRASGAPGSQRGPRAFLRRALAYRITRRLIWEALDRFRPHAVHCHDATTLPIGGPWCRRHRDVALVFDSHELYEEVAGISSTMRLIWRRVIRRFAKDIRGFITINESIAREHANRHPALPPAVLVMNAVPRVPSIPAYDGRLHRAAELAPTTRILLYQGGYSRHRGLEQLVRAAAGLPEGWALVMMGWGGIEPELRAIAEQSGTERVRFIPPVPQADLLAWTAGATLGVIPYENTCLNHWYCTPNKLWEYPSAGVPILASPFPELRRPIDRYRIGSTLPSPLNAEALRSAIASISEPSLEAMREGCRRFVEAEHWEVFARRLVDAYGTWLGAPLPKAAAPETEASITEPKPDAVIGLHLDDQIDATIRAIRGERSR